MLDLIINILFIFDIIIGFRTTYFDPMGNKIRSPKLVAMKYVKGMFLVDFFSSIPYRYVKEIFPPIDNISFLKILKIARISRFGPFVQKLELNAEDKAVSDPMVCCSYLPLHFSMMKMTNPCFFLCSPLVAQNHPIADHAGAHSSLSGLCVVHYRLL